MNKQFDPAAFGAAIATFSVVIPTDYDSKTQIDTFRLKLKQEVLYWNSMLTSASFPNPSQQLEPGKTYKVNIWPITPDRVVSTEECLAFLADKNVHLTGGHGLTLLHQIAADKFPVGKSVASFDQKENLWNGAIGHPRVPFSGLRSDGLLVFDLWSFWGLWTDFCCLLGFELVES